jgi:hypothetical protein
MKKVLLVVALLTGFIAPAHADVPPSIAVIDSGAPDSLFPNIVGEYCVVEFFSCPNGTNTQEGAGAANIAPSTNAALTHGSEMMSIMNQVEPSAKLVSIRIIGQTANGLPAVYTLAAVKSALDWIIVNQSKYNIKVVNISQGRVFANCAVPAGLAEDVTALVAKGVQVVAATGNDANRTAMFAPACLPNVISVGATDNPDPGTTGKAWDPKAKPTIATYSNGNAQTTYYTNGRYYAIQPNGSRKFIVGTSNATAAMSAFLLNHQVTTTGVATNQWLTGKYVFIG